MKKILLLFLLVLLSGCTVSQNVVIFTSEGEISVEAEIADSSEERATGLMFREELDKNAGMLFIFEDEQPRTFWMKNTELSLDMIFINSDKEIVQILEHAVPCESDPCALYPSELPAQYVLEVNSGYVQEHNIKVGDKLKF